MMILRSIRGFALAPSRARARVAANSRCVVRVCLHHQSITTSSRTPSVYVTHHRIETRSTSSIEHTRDAFERPATRALRGASTRRATRARADARRAVT